MRIETEPGISQLVEVEMFSALSRRVRMGEISQEDARKIVERFQADVDSGFYACIPLQPIHYQLARDWISRFETPLRTLDALHLAIAALHDLCLVTADKALFVSAEVFGVKVQIIRPQSED